MHLSIYEFNDFVLELIFEILYLGIINFNQE
jgi:hypothetical protein